MNCSKSVYVYTKVAILTMSGHQSLSLIIEAWGSFHSKEKCFPKFDMIYICQFIDSFFFFFDKFF